MSLEAAIQENTSVLRELLARLSAGAIVANPNAAPKSATVAGESAPGPTTAKADAPTKTANASGQSVGTAGAAAQASTAATVDAKKSAAVSQQSETAAAPNASKPEASTSVAAVTYDDVKALVLQVSKNKGRDAAAAVLAGFGVAKAPELKPEQYADAVAQLKAALA